MINLSMSSRLEDSDENVDYESVGCWVVYLGSLAGMLEFSIERSEVT